MGEFEGCHSHGTYGDRSVFQSTCWALAGHLNRSNFQSAWLIPVGQHRTNLSSSAVLWFALAIQSSTEPTTGLCHAHPGDCRQLMPLRAEMRPQSSSTQTLPMDHSYSEPKLPSLAPMHRYHRANERRVFKTAHVPSSEFLHGTTDAPSRSM